MVVNFPLYVLYLDLKTWKIFKDHTRTVIVIHLPMKATDL